EAALSREQFAGARALRRRLAERGPAFRAGAAATTAGRKDADDLVSWLQVLAALSTGLHVARSLVSQHHGNWPRARTVDNRKIRMAGARGGNADQDLATAGWLEFNFPHFQGAAFRVGGVCVGACQYGGFDLHAF